MRRNNFADSNSFTLGRLFNQAKNPVGRGSKGTERQNSAGERQDGVEQACAANCREQSVRQRCCSGACVKHRSHKEAFGTNGLYNISRLLISSHSTSTRSGWFVLYCAAVRLA
ncbi:MAG: hypothetical protein DMF10_01630 [Verrucomicrobia bacterium]|nr:MAG: hypothetical protein DMF10_01630 [Verrucomicrobiota bacterium]